MRKGSIIALLCCLVFASACRSTALPPMTSGQFSALEADEARLWKRSDEQVKNIEGSGLVYADQELESYVNAVARRLMPSSTYERIPFAVKVLRDPHFNTFALANGAVYLHTGILAAMENEAELATLLGHEMTHATNRDQIRFQRDVNNKSGVMNGISLITMGVGSLFAPIAAASVYGFSRDIERNADREGFALTARAGYDVSQANRLFERMKREIEAEKKQEPYFLGTHPRIVERIESYNELMAAADRNGPPGDKNAETFQARVKKLLLDNAELDMQIERYEKAEIQLKRYAERYPGEAAPFYLLGEANRRRLDGEHDKKAGEYYRKALSLDPAHADSHKMLGTMLYKARDLAAAREHLQAYLSLKPEAADRAYIEGYIRTCDQRHQPAAPDSPGR